MKEDKLFDIWEKGNDGIINEKIDKNQIAGYLQHKTYKVSRYFYLNIAFYWIIQLVNIILISMNLVGYENNPVILWVLVAMLAFSLGGLIYGIIIFYRFREINNYTNTLTNLINKQIGFLKIYYEIWLFIISLSILVLIFNVNIMVDNDNGHYPINHKGLYIIINVVIFCFIYLTQKMSGVLITRSLKAYLLDLHDGLLEQSVRVEKSKRKFKWLLILLGIIFTVTLIIGLLKFLQAGQ